METYQGYFASQDKFVPTGTVRIPLRRRTIVTVLDEPVQDQAISDEISQRLRDFEELNAMIDASSDEEVPDFPRADLFREVDL